jgi:uncharacterized repeat protein (TIGR04052 family)
MYGRAVLVLLVTGLLQACGEPATRVQIPFVAMFAGVPLDCTANGDLQLTDLRLYIHDVRLTNTSGREQQLRLDDDGIWQQPNLALLDLESGTAGCSNGTVDIHDVLAGMLARGEYRGLTFTLGVPFEQNHGDPLLAAAPLGDAAMHWHWRGGYKFLRAGWRTADDGFWLHLGSTGCVGTLQNITGCRSPNRVEIRLDDFVPGRDQVVIDLSELVAPAELADGTASDCSSGPAEGHCAVAFAAFGLDHASGATAGVQRVFSSRVQP